MFGGPPGKQWVLVGRTQNGSSSAGSTLRGLFREQQRRQPAGTAVPPIPQFEVDSITATQQLLNAAGSGNVQWVQALLDAGVAVDGTHLGHTPLHTAVGSGHAGVVQVLLEAGADVNSLDPVSQRTALHTAAQKGHAGVVQLLVSAPMVSAATLSAAARAGAAAGHAGLAAVILRALLARDPAAAAGVMDQPQLAAEMLRQLQAAEARVREVEAERPALQQLLVGIAIAHQQLRESAGYMEPQ